MHSTTNKWSLALNSTSVIIVGTGLYCHYAYAHLLPLHLSKAGANQFFTVISAWLTVIYQAASIASYISQSQALFNFKNNYVLPTALMAEFLVSIVYWGLKLFLPFICFDMKIPLVLDFAVHILPFLSLFSDYFLFVPHLTVPQVNIIAKGFTLTFAYCWWLVYLIDVENGQQYPYTFLDVADVYSKLAIYSLAFVISISGFTALRYVKEKSFALVKQSI